MQSRQSTKSISKENVQRRISTINVDSTFAKVFLKEQIEQVVAETSNESEYPTKS